MKQTLPFIALSLALATLSWAVQAQQPVGRWNLGEQDAGAVADSPGLALSTDAVSTNGLAAFGAPVYSGQTPSGGSTLSMSFDGASCYQASAVGSGAGLDVLYAGFPFDNLSLACDVYMTAPGAAGFSFPVSMGKNGGGFAIVEIGGSWHIIHQSIGTSAAQVPVAINAWTHLDLQRQDLGAGPETRLLINGEDTGLAIGATPGNIQPYFTLGGNRTGNGGIEGLFKGQIDNVILRTFGAAETTISLQLIDGQAKVEGQGAPGLTYRLQRSTTLAPDSWSDITSSTADAAGRVQWVDTAPPAGGAFYRSVTP